MQVTRAWGVGQWGTGALLRVKFKKYFFSPAFGHAWNTAFYFVLMRPELLYDSNYSWLDYQYSLYKL